MLNHIFRQIVRRIVGLGRSTLVRCNLVIVLGETLVQAVKEVNQL